MTPYTTFYDDVMPELPGAELPVVLYQIKRVCKDFYERSLYSRETLPGINVVALTSSYSVVASDAANFEVGKILSVRFNNGSSAGPSKLDPRTKDQLDIELPNWDTQTGNPRYYTQTGVDNVTLALVPNTSYAAGLIVRVSKIPLSTGGGIDDFVYDKFGDEIGLGVKARMMRMPKKPWSNPVMAGAYMTEFDQEVAAAAMIAAREFGAGRLRTRAWG